MVENTQFSGQSQEVSMKYNLLKQFYSQLPASYNETYENT